MSRKSQRFLVTIWTEERTPGDIARALAEGDLRIIDPEVETIHVAVYGDDDIAIEPGTSRMIPIQGAACVNPGAITFYSFRTDISGPPA